MLTAISSDNASVANEMEAVAEVRKLDKVFPPQFANFVSVDSRELLTIEVKPDDVSTDRGADSAVWNRSRLAVGAYDQLFERLWEINVKPTKQRNGLNR